MVPVPLPGLTESKTPAGLMRKKEKCDLLARLEISDRNASLNVSNAAAVALYALTLRP